MFTIDMTLEEVNELTRILTKEMGELHTEIHHTDDRGFRSNLKMRERLLRDMLIHCDKCHVAEV